MKVRGFKKREVIVVDSKDKEIGTKDIYEVHKHPLSLHRAISVVIFNSKRDGMLVQKRSSFKPTWPLFWSNTVCTHPFPGESVEAAAKRRLMEEMGIVCGLKKKFSFSYNEKYDEKYGEYEIDHVFVGEYNGDVKVDPKEVADYKWIKSSVLNKDIKDNPDNYTPWFKMILKKLQI